MHKTILILLLLAQILFTACSGKKVIQKPKGPMYQHGHLDGCTTSNGTYSKNSKYFRQYKAYADGWFDGRRNCEHSNTKRS